MVLSGDVPLIASAQIEHLVRAHREGGFAATVLAGTAEQPTGYGRIISDAAGLLLGIVEERDADEAQRAICTVNTGIYCFAITPLLDALDKLSCDNAQGEYYLTDTIALLREAGLPVGCHKAEGFAYLMGANDRVQLLALQRLAQTDINRRLLESGVGFLDPSSTFVGPDAVLAPGCVLYPGTLIFGKSRIGAGCTLGPSSQLRDAVLGENCTVNASVLRGCHLGDGVSIGPFANLRPGSTLQDGVKIGDFVEVKNSTIGRGSKVSHLSYIGDSDIGDDCNIGCGAVTVNYDGKNKFRTTVGDGAFIGCNANLVAPVSLGAGSFVAAGSTITSDVDEDALAIARARQVNKPGLAKKRRGTTE